VWELIRNTFAAVNRFFYRCSMRLGLWMWGVIGALFPIVYAAHEGAPDFNFPATINKIDSSGLFRDLFYVGIVVALVGLGNILYNLLASEGEVHLWLRPVLFFLAIGFVWLILSGLGEFSRLAHLPSATPAPSSDDLASDQRMLMYVAVVGVFTEIVLAFRNV
jgi:hypothetical protein